MQLITKLCGQNLNIKNGVTYYGDLLILSA